MSAVAGDLPEQLVGDVQTDLVRDIQRIWILSAMAKIACEHGPESVTVRDIVGRAGVSRRRFYELFENREDCFRAVFEEAIARAAEKASVAYEAEREWADRIRAGLAALLEFFDSEPELARLCVLHATPASPATVASRSEVLTRLAEIVDEGRRAAPDSASPPPLAGASVVGGALSVIQARLLEPSPDPLRELLNPLMGVIVLPYLGPTAAQRELSRPVRDAAASPATQESARDALEDLDMRLTYRTLRVLAEIAAAPGISNRAVAEAAGVRDPGQISKLLARVERLGLVRNTGAGQSKGAPNAWTVTSRGAEVDRAIGPVAEIGTRRRVTRAPR
jgi:AcrR family transcriptional regulator